MQAQMDSILDAVGRLFIGCLVVVGLLVLTILLAAWELVRML